MTGEPGIAWAVLRHPVEDYDWHPALWQRVRLRAKAALLLAVGRIEGGYPHNCNTCGRGDDAVYPYTVWVSGSLGRADWEYGGTCWNEVQVPKRGWHVHFFESSSV